MNGKRAKALNRIRRGMVRLEDVQRLKRTEGRHAPEAKTQPERRKPTNPPTALAMAVWGVKP